MFDTRKELSLENVYEKISEESIFTHLIPNANFKTNFSVRSKNGGSASITSYGGKLYFKDFKDTMQPKAETWIQYVCRREGLNADTKEGYLKALDWINSAFNLGLKPLGDSVIVEQKFKLNTNYVKPNYEKETIKTKIEVKRSNWTIKDLEYWNQFGITKEWLIRKRIAPISHYWITNPKKGNMRKLFEVGHKLAFVYPYGKNENGVYIFKIYMPGSDYKWVSNCGHDIIENWRFIKERKENLIIQSSFKDTIVMEIFRDDHLVLPNYDIIAPIAEGIWFRDWNLIRSSYKKIVLYGNNDWDEKDNPGLAYARKWCKKYHIPFITNPDWARASDISDYRRDRGELRTLELLKDLETKINLL